MHIWGNHGAILHWKVLRVKLGLDAIASGEVFFHYGPLSVVIIQASLVVSDVLVDLDVVDCHSVDLDATMCFNLSFEPFDGFSEQQVQSVGIEQAEHGATRSSGANADRADIVGPVVAIDEC